MRREKFGDWPLDVILAENMRNADEYFIMHLMPLLPEDFLSALLPGMVETSIGKMVPIMTQKDIDQDPLQVFAEPYNDLIVSGPGFKNPLPAINNLLPKKNIKAWVDRILKAMITGFSFRAVDEKGNLYEQDKKFFIEAEKGIVHILSYISGFTNQEVQQIAKIL